MKIYNDTHSVHEIGYHIIWCTKYRQAVIKDMVELELKKIIVETCEHYGWEIGSLETMTDHVHIFVRADHMTAPIEIGKILKSISAVHLFSKFPELKGKRFWGSGLWSRGTYYGSVGNMSEEVVRRYIENQKG